jgi:cellulose synthase/poly-beta-1,6-N-acetylglucosamine synthase-like glycosyltransferase
MSDDSIAAPVDSNVSSQTRRRARSITEQMYLLRHANEIHENVEVEDEVKQFIDLPIFESPSAKEKFQRSIASGVEKTAQIYKPQLLKVQVSQLPFGMSVNMWQFVGFCVLCCLFLHTWSCYLIYTFLWSVQLGSLYFGFIRTKRPDYDATRRRYDTHAKLYEANGVTILKPLHGVPGRLAVNLETYFNLRYPKFEILLCIKEKKGREKLVELCEKLMKKYPHVDCTISYGYQSWGINPKLCNMGTGYDIAKYDLVWVADANIVASDCVIQDLVEKCVSEENVALVHQIPWMISGPGKTPNDPHSSLGYITDGSVLDRWYFATGHARSYLLVNNILCTCLNGMSSIMKRKKLETVGGLEHFAQYVAEDAEIGNALDAEGYSSLL